MLDQYEMELERIWALIPTKEEIAILLEEIQTHARASELKIISLSRIPKPRTSAPGAKKEEKYVRVPYKIVLGGSYFGLIRFMRKLEDSRRLVTMTDIKVNSVKGKNYAEAEIQFNIFYSRAGVEAG
jgi:type IV pilus assembly protein PilO